MESVVQPLGRTLTVHPGANLLNTLRESKMPISRSCTRFAAGSAAASILVEQKGVLAEHVYADAFYPSGI